MLIPAHLLYNRVRHSFLYVSSLEPSPCTCVREEDPHDENEYEQVS